MITEQQLANLFKTMNVGVNRECFFDTNKQTGEVSVCAVVVLWAHETGKPIGESVDETEYFEFDKRFCELEKTGKGYDMNWLKSMSGAFTFPENPDGTPGSQFGLKVRQLVDEMYPAEEN